MFRHGGRVCFVLLALFSSVGLQAAERITLQLKWSHAFQFAGYYAALAQGYYAEAGLEVSLSEARPGIDPIDELLSGRADYAVGNSSALIANHQGKPLVVLATIFQHSPRKAGRLAPAGPGQRA
jgi:ABC-type nitrate/sulfonate/bicarbonate transport system substrate-binding protein